MAAEYYSEAEARTIVIEAGLKLVESRLIARTWGNISARISADEFIITPSGMAYEGLTPEKLVKVRVSDCGYEGEIKPSSEKKVHAAAYALRPDIRFIIHTHQHYASAICAAGRSVPFAPCAEYGLPGTDRLRDAVSACVSANPGAKSFLMEKHGALILGESYAEAFSLAGTLENNCRVLYERKANTVSHARTLLPWLDDYAQLVGFGLKKADDGDEEAVAMIVDKNRAAAMYVTGARPLSPADALLQRCVYLFKYSKLKDK